MLDRSTGRDVVVVDAQVRTDRSGETYTDRAGGAPRAQSREGDCRPEITPERLTDAQASMLAAAYLGLAAWWMTDGKDLGAEAVDAIFQRTVGPAR